MLHRCLLLLAVASTLLLLLPQASSLTVHVVPHTHDDVGWLKTVDQYYYGLHNEIQHAAVQYIIKSVMAALARNPQRKFMYVEQAFFQRYWREATQYDKNLTYQAVNSGQLEFVNGGWCMHDEAAAHYIDMVDQTTLGHKFIVEEFGVEKVPTIGWQIDPFGHSSTQASLLSGVMGFDGLFFGRIDYQDHGLRIANKNLEFIWRASPSLGASAQVFTGAFQSGNYGPPDGFCFDAIDCGDEPIQSNPDAPDYNLDRKVQDFVKAAMRQAAGTNGDVESMNIMWNMGSDFQYEAAEEWFTNLDKIIDGVNSMANGSIKAMYSSPSIYLKAKNAEQAAWTVKTDDFFPYADDADSYWTGYFTSRPALKRYIRIQSAFLQVARHMELFSGGDGTATERLWEAQSVAQHHDAISGTAKQAVTNDYARRLALGGAIADQLIESTLADIVTTTGQAPTFAYCPLANVSECDAVTSHPASTIIVVLYNPTARASDDATTLSIPSSTKNPTLYDGAGKVVPSTTLPVFTNAANAHGNATYRTWFRASIPGLGVQTYFLQQGGQREGVVKGGKRFATKGRTLDSDGADEDAALPPAPTAQSRGDHLPLPPAPAVTDRGDHLPLPAAPGLTERGDHLWQLKSNAVPAAAPVLENAGVRVTFDATTNLIVSITDKTSNQTYPFTQDFAWYPSYQVDKKQDSGAYIFRPAINGTYSLSGETKLVQLVNGETVSEAWLQVTPWVSLIVRLRAGARGVEFEWTVGPIPVVADDQGKEIIIRFNSSLASHATWYTDSNGREFQERTRNQRPTWKWAPTQPFAGNYYPVNAAAWLTDGTSAMVVNVDRSQGCSSMVDGTLEFMVHRRMVKDDGRGVGEALNETGLDGHGLIITGSTWVHLSPLADAAYHARATANELYTPVHQSYAALSGSIADYVSGHQTNATFLKTDLPDSVELITAQVWDGGKVLVRLAHSYGEGESAQYSKPVSVDLSSLFVVPITEAQEMTLSAAVPKTSRPTGYSWKTRDDPQPAQWRLGKKATVHAAALNITINPMEVRTFLCTTAHA